MYRNILYSSYNQIYSSINSSKLTDDVVAQWSKAYSHFLPKNLNAKIADIGCGTGLFLSFLKTKGYRNLTGVDGSASQVEIAKNKGLKVVQGDAEIFIKDNRNIDLITIFDVVEHFHKDEFIHFLVNAKNSLSENGSILIRTINAASLYGGESRYIDYTHETSFTETSLRQVLGACGFKDIQITDNQIPFGLRPRRFFRWLALKVLRRVQRFIFLIEVGVDAPVLYGKFLIVHAKK
jgi:2-polyprenyl-3-methyl-5-hydroxy-6-metoxy-1,4-benzoquinol methylase